MQKFHSMTVIKKKKDKDEELDGYGDTPLEAVYNCFVNCVKCKVIS